MKKWSFSEFKQREVIEKQETAKIIILAAAMKEAYSLGLLEAVTPIWNTEKITIKNAPILKDLKPNFNVDVIIKNVDVKLLFSVMQGNSNLEVILEKKLFHQNKNDVKTYKIIDNWKNGFSLPPPTLFYIIDSNKFEITDGSHRFNAAYCFGAISIPIIISKQDFKLLQTFIK